MMFNMDIYFAWLASFVLAYDETIIFFACRNQSDKMHYVSYSNISDNCYYLEVKKPNLSHKPTKNSPAVLNPKFVKKPQL